MENQNYPQQAQPYTPPQGYVPPQMPPCAPQPPEPPKSLGRPGSKRDLIYALILGLLCILAADFYLWGRAGLGAAIVTVLVFFTGTCYLYKSRRKLTGYGIYCAAAYLAGAVSFVFSNDSDCQVLLVLFLVILGTVSIMELMALRQCKDGGYGGLPDFFYAAFALTFGSIGRCFYALFHREGAEGKTESRKFGAALIGIACSLPALIIIVPLLMDSDAAFSNLLDRLAFENMGEILGALILGLAAFVLVFGRLFSVRTIRREPKEYEKTWGLAPLAICSFLSAIALVYVLYLISQLAYFFSAFSGLLPENFTVASYARRGFFEMCTVCAINLGLIFLTDLLCKKNSGKSPLALKLLSLFFCLFSLILIGTALSKMVLYIGSFGMTRLRILTSVFMLFLAVVFVAISLRLFLKKVPYVKIALIAGSLLLIFTCYANIDGVIAEYNVTAYQNGKLDAVDMDTLEELDRASAVPWLLELASDKDAGIAKEAHDLLKETLSDFFAYERYNHKTDYEYSPLDWREYNTVKAKARQLLWEWKIAENITPYGDA